eukprot:1159469-Pelagomonas_calceolata.AAC.3
MSCHTLQTLTKILNTRHTLYLQGFSGGKLLWAKQHKGGEGDSKPAGAWLITRQTLTSYLLSARSLI